MVFFSQARRLAKQGAAILLLSVLASCASLSGRYAGIDLNAVPANSEAAAIQALARRAQAGDKYTQLELGIRYENGDGVARDLERAKKLYRSAASDSGGRIWVYSPPVGNGTSGRVIPVDAGPKQYGLAEAKKRLELIQ